MKPRSPVVAFPSGGEPFVKASEWVPGIGRDERLKTCEGVAEGFWVNGCTAHSAASSSRSPSDTSASARNTSSRRKLLAGFVLALEIKLDLDVVRIAQKDLPSGAIRHLVHVVLDAHFGEMPLRGLEAAAAESDMIDDT
jgi:hypothetical protein